MLNNLYNVVLLPPVAFTLIFGVVLILSWLLSFLSFKGKLGKGARKAYACGEDVTKNRVQVNYNQFFPFAFFFTILHMVALMITTVPTITIKTFLLALIYISVAMVGLMILFRRDEDTDGVN